VTPLGLHPTLHGIPRKIQPDCQRIFLPRILQAFLLEDLPIYQPYLQLRILLDNLLTDHRENHREDRREGQREGQREVQREDQLESKLFDCSGCSHACLLYSEGISIVIVIIGPFLITFLTLLSSSNIFNFVFDLFKLIKSREVLAAT
jgi:hypothetical protein